MLLYPLTGRAPDLSSRDNKKRRRPNLSQLLLPGLLVGAAVATQRLEGWEGVRDGFEGSVSLLGNALPFLLLGIALAGMIQVLVPPGAVGKWMGDDMGARGLLIGMLVGTLTPGGPFIMFPIAAALLNSGAGVGPMAGFVATRNLVTLNRAVVWEVPFLGAPFVVARILASLYMPIVSVLLVPVVYRLMPGKGVPGKRAPGRGGMSRPASADPAPADEAKP